ncbi:MAG: VWA domain-containing protein [Jatrophihabitans sp.]|uniref:vWA domain-containing protein n=1 Tax=Jatrophihabitans sp. TaxID=1932789 RepID=UPI00390FC9AF
MSAGTGDAADPVVTMTGFARALRANGVAADPTRLTNAIEALAHVDPLDAEQVYWTGRVTLCAEPDDLPRYDAVFDAWFRGRLAPVAPPAQPGRPGQVVQLRPAGGEPGDTEVDDDEDPLRTAASDAEVLRHRDVTALSDAERDEINRLIALLTPRVGRRRTRRHRPGGRRAIDVPRTVRAMLRDGGEPAELARLRPRSKPRRLVLVLDVSGSMSPYADVLLRFAHAAVRVAPASTEVFTVSTRLTRVTRQLRLRDADEALATAGTAIPDWSGGTRLGQSLQAFLDLWGQRGTARRAVVVIASDGWERGDSALLGEQMGRLARLAYRVVWVNPHRGKDGFAPVTGGMTAALPHVDELLAGHTLDALHTLADVIAHA